MRSINYPINLHNNKLINTSINNINSNIDAFFIFGLHKSGSTLLNSIFKEICSEAQIGQIALEEILFSKGIPPKEVDVDKLQFNDGICFRGFRYLWIKEAYKKKKMKSILLVRDPRDAIVSYFFSDKYSHPIPEKGDIADNKVKLRDQMAAIQEVDDDKEWLFKRANFLKNNFNDYTAYLNKEYTRIYRYEDIIFYKYEWIKDMVDYLGIKISDNKIKEIAIKNDIVPNNEDPTKHIRSVVPGNYKKHFKNETIIELNKIFKDILHKFEYDTIRYF